MFCNSLRKRSEWALVPSALLSSQNPKWREQTLETHDLAIPLPQPKQKIGQEFFLFLLLSSSDLQAQISTMARIERLYHQTGGRHVGIIFLLQGKGTKENGTKAYMDLQASLPTTLQMPIIPLSTASQLQSTLFAFHRHLISTLPMTILPPGNPTTALLPFCSVNAPLSEHTRNVLSDIYPSIRELAQACVTCCGQEHLRKWLSEPTFKDVVDFWKEEYVVE